MNTSAAVLDRLGTLGDMTRCRLLALLEGEEFTVSELCQVLQLPQPTVSRHLKVLADDGWVVARAEGTSRWYRTREALPDGAGALWRLVRSELEDTETARLDRERARSVLMRREDRARAFVSASAARWDELRAELYGARADLVPLLGLLEPHWTAADLGTGSGALPAMLAPFVERVIGVDRSPEMLEAAARRTGHLDNVTLRQGDLEALPLEDASVDLAFLSLVLHFVPRPGRVLAEAHRILRPGGRLVIVDLREHGRAEYREEMGHQWPGFSPELLAGWLEDAGLDPAPHQMLSPDPDARGPALFVRTARRPAPTET